MRDLSRSALAAYVVAALAVALIGARYLRATGAEPGGGGGGGTPVPSVQVQGGAGGGGGANGDGGSLAVVQVAGAVARPGVYRLRTTLRVDDAVRMAGGPTARADLTGVNLAAKVEDGRQVIVPERPAVGAAGAAGAGAGSAGTPGIPLNLNTATVAQLDELDGIGPATAQSIVAYRQEHGGFRSVAELDGVAGIGPKRLQALKDLVRV